MSISPIKGSGQPTKPLPEEMTASVPTPSPTALLRAEITTLALSTEAVVLTLLLAAPAFAAETPWPTVSWQIST